ncbi:MAG: right-handed parallel beta-helix repeat-containing protein [Candidatus Hodarchaeota archaeon]
MLGLINWTVDTSIHPTTQILFSPLFIERHTTVLQKTTNTQTYIPHSPILISSDSHFVSQGFSGSGTINDPYRIENLNITTSNGDLISISDITVYFCIQNNKLDGLTTATSGISLSNVQHATIENNSIHSNWDGIKATNISNAIFFNNSIYSNARFGVFLTKVTNCTLASNTIHDNLVNGVQLKDSYKTTISSNTIYNHQYGEYFHSSILLDNSSSTLITNNSLFNNHYGINFLNSADDNLITNNTIYGNQEYGIRLEYVSKNMIEFNTIIDNLLYGIQITIGSNDNTIQFNNFKDNNDGSIQASDDGINNIFTGNYWDDLDKVDANEDLIIDNPYPIDGTANNFDHYPLVEFSSEAIDKIGKNPFNSGIFFFILIILTVFGGSTGLGYFVYKTRLNQQDVETEFETEEPLVDFDLSEQIEHLKPLYHKLVVGIENLQTSTLPQPVTVPLLEPPEPITLVEYFPSDIKNDLRSGMRWRTIFTLIEIAYQDPSETNPVKLAQSLDIPAPTLSKEIKKLKELHYIESFVSAQVLRDGRYRSYTITQKGFRLLYILKETLKLTITRLKEKEGAYYM